MIAFLRLSVLVFPHVETAGFYLSNSRQLDPLPSFALLLIGMVVSESDHSVDSELIRCFSTMTRIHQDVMDILAGLWHWKLMAVKA